MTPLVDAWSHMAWTQLWQVTVLIAAVAFVVRLAARNRPHLAHALWLVVLVKCVTPPVFCTSAGVFCWMQSSVPDRPSVPTRWAQVEVSSADPELPGTLRAGALNEYERLDESVVGNVGTTTLAKASRPGLLAWLFGVWMVGAVVYLATVFNGQKACVHDVTRSPFVVSVARVQGDFAEAIQPVIRVVDEGARVQIQPQLSDDGSIRVACEMTLSKILDVDTYTFDRKGKAGTTVQVPEVETLLINATGEVPPGKTLLVGGLKSRTSDSHAQSMLLMLTPTKVDADVVAERESPM